MKAPKPKQWNALKRLYLWCRTCDLQIYARPNSLCPSCLNRLFRTRLLFEGAK